MSFKDTWNVFLNGGVFYYSVLQMTWAAYSLVYASNVTLKNENKSLVGFPRLIPTVFTRSQSSQKDNAELSS